MNSLAVSETTRELWSARKVADELGMSVSAVWRYARLGRVLPEPAVVEGGDWTCIWFADDIRRFKAERGIA